LATSSIIGARQAECGFDVTVSMTGFGHRDRTDFAGQHGIPQIQGLVATTLGRICQRWIELVMTHGSGWFMANTANPRTSPNKTKRRG
jgi:hypothetical protein